MELTRSQKRIKAAVESASIGQVTVVWADPRSGKTTLYREYATDWMIHRRVVLDDPPLHVADADGFLAGLKQLAAAGRFAVVVVKTPYARNKRENEAILRLDDADRVVFLRTSPLQGAA